MLARLGNARHDVPGGDPEDETEMAPIDTMQPDGDDTSNFREALKKVTLKTNKLHIWDVTNEGIKVMDLVLMTTLV
jgi:hypothetical protein